MDFTKAVDAHVVWKLKLQTAIRNNEQLDQEVISKDDQCEIGKWIHGEGEQYKDSDAYKTLRANHAHFHKCASNVVATINAGDSERALSMLEAGSEFTSTSTETVSSIIKMRRVIEEAGA